MPGQEKMVMDFYQKNPSAVASLRGTVYEEKILNLIKEKAKPEIISKNLAELKANKVSLAQENQMVLGADSVIDLEGEIISKPNDRVEALEILKRMNGKTHQLISSVCISRGGSMIWNYTDKASLTMKNMTFLELENYLKKISDEDLYAYNVYQIEGEGRNLFSKIEGDEDTIMGLPVKKIKEYLSDSKYRIYLHDLVTKITREVIASTSDDIFPPSSPWTIDGFSDRLVKYEQASNDLISTTALLGYWAGNENQEALTLPARRLSERIQTASGVNFWLALRWYPVLLMSYSMGIAAISSSRYENLAKLFHTPISELHQPSLEFPLIVSLGNGISDLHNAFKELPGHERQYVPRSEYLYKHLQPKLDDLLFLGSEYDWLFDKYELLFALEFGHQLLKIKNHFWAPLGRFSWKRRDGGGPFNRLVKEAQFAKDDWAPLKGGFFDNSYERFLEISQKFEQRQQQLPF